MRFRTEFHYPFANLTSTNRREKENEDILFTLVRVCWPSYPLESFIGPTLMRPSILSRPKYTLHTHPPRKQTQQRPVHVGRERERDAINVGMCDVKQSVCLGAQCIRGCWEVCLCALLRLTPGARKPGGRRGEAGGWNVLVQTVREVVGE